MGAHGSTFGGNPVVVRGRASRCSRRSADEGLVANAAARGAELNAGLQAIAAEDPRIGDVRGPGLMIGVEFVKDRERARAGRRARRCPHRALRGHGLLLLTCGPDHNIIRWIPPLDVVRAPRSTKALGIFTRALAEVGPRPYPDRTTEELLSRVAEGPAR